jgi:hypothetical protein
MQVVMHDLLKSLPSVQDALTGLASSGAEARGAIFTRREVVDFILDLCEYTTDQPLTVFRLLEPSAGDGDFLLPVIERLLATVKEKKATKKLLRTIRAVEIHGETCEATRKKLVELLKNDGFPTKDALSLADTWLIQDDYLLTDLGEKFTHVVGNPPYVRQELIPGPLLTAYKERFTTIYDRADLYVPFIEKSLDSLEDGGRLGFICADRWMKNKYGTPLREFVSRRFHLATYVDMVDTNAFHADVIAYPAITIINKGRGDITHVAHRPQVNSKALSALVPALQGKALHSSVSHVAGVANGSKPWMLRALDQVSIVRRLEAELPLLEETGCKVGIGVATGADKVYCGDYDALPVEQSRKLPLVVTKDIVSGSVKWTGKGVVNPFGDDGRLVDLKAYPKLSAYFKSHETLLKKRNCAKRNDSRWYRTIDRITPSLALKPKLLIPDIKGKAHVVYEEGKLYPHHNLYYIVSDIWNLHALQAVLMSGIAELFVANYSVQMAGGFLRFQAQYLRRIRVPHWKDVPAAIQKKLIAAGKKQDRQAADRLVSQLYRLTSEECKSVGINNPSHAP